MKFDLKNMSRKELEKLKANVEKALAKLSAADKKAALVAAEKAAENVKSLHGLSSVDVFVKGVGLGRDAAIRAVGAFDITVDSIKDVTGVPHGGVRPRKARRA